jgi:hypothetical protein
MKKVQKPVTSQHCTPSSKAFRIYLITSRIRSADVGGKDNIVKVWFQFRLIIFLILIILCNAQYSHVLLIAQIHERFVCNKDYR